MEIKFHNKFIVACPDKHYDTVAGLSELISLDLLPKLNVYLPVHLLN